MSIAHRECNEKSHSHNAEFYEIYHRASQHFKTRDKTYYYADGEKKIIIILKRLKKIH